MFVYIINTIVLCSCFWQIFYCKMKITKKKSTRTLILTLKKIKPSSKLTEDRHADHIFQNLLKCKFSQSAKHRKLISTKSSNGQNILLDSTGTEPAASWYVGREELSAWFWGHSASMLQGSIVSTSDPALELWIYVRRKKKKKQFNFQKYSSLQYFWPSSHVHTFCDNVLEYVLSWNLYHPTTGPRIVIFNMFVALSYQPLFTNCMWN